MAVRSAPILVSADTSFAGPNVLEEEFCELRLLGFLRTSRKQAPARDCVSALDLSEVQRLPPGTGSAGNSRIEGCYDWLRLATTLSSPRNRERAGAP